MPTAVAAIPQHQNLPHVRTAKDGPQPGRLPLRVRAELGLLLKQHSEQLAQGGFYDGFPRIE
jgi:hypothetical protein